MFIVVYCLFGSPLATTLAVASLPGVHTEIKYMTLNNTCTIQYKKTVKKIII